MDWQLTTDFTHGNAAAVELQNAEDGVPTVYFSAHPQGGTESLWWCFRLTRKRGRGGGSLRLAWRHYQNCLGLGGAGAARLVHPVVRRDGGAWERITAGSERNLGNGCSTAVWEVAAPRQWLEAAFCFPHGPEEVAELSDAIGWNADAVGISSAGRELVRLSNDYGSRECEADGRRPGVYCVAHQHASEMSGAWALHGFLAEMARRGPEAPLVWAMPVLNVDGVNAGDYGKDPFPWDLNRAWGWPPMRAEVLACMRDVEVWRRRCEPLLCLDFHSPGGVENDGVYTFLHNPGDNAEYHARGAAWADYFIAELEEFAAAKFKRVANYPGRFRTEQHSTFSKFYCDEQTLGMTFEVPYHRIKERVLQTEDYLNIGARMAGAVCAGIVR